MLHGKSQCGTGIAVPCDVLRHFATRTDGGDMFTRRQAIRWAELWLSCWNDGDHETLLAMHRDDARFGVWDGGTAGGARLDRKEAMRRHWAAVPFGLHSVPVELDEIAWDPESREITIVYVAELAGVRVRGCDLVALDAT